MELLKKHQQKIALAVGFVAVALLGYYGGLNINSASTKTAKPSLSSSNYSQSVSGTQTKQSTPEDKPSASSIPGNCEGKIKGSSSHIYHMPDGVFYAKTTKPIACFDTEAAAQAAGFRKSSR